MGHFFNFDPESTLAILILLLGMTSPPVIPGKIEKNGTFFQF